METPNPEEGNAEWVAVKEGDQDWMKELADMLTGKGIPAGMTLAPGCSAGTCGCRFIILVAEKESRQHMTILKNITWPYTRNSENHRSGQIRTNAPHAATM